MAQLMRGLQDWGIEDIARRIAKMGRVSTTAEYELTLLMEQDTFQIDWKKKLAEALGVTDKRLEELFQEASKANYIYDKRAFEAAGIPLRNTREISLLRNIVEQTKGDFANMTRSMGFARQFNGRVVFEPIAKFYQTELNMATTKIASGLQTFDVAVKEAVERMADSGMRTVSFASGRRDRIDVAARRAMLGGMKELTVRQSQYNAQAMGLTTFEFSWHGGHRPSHGWGGRRYDQLGVHYPRREVIYTKYGGGTLEDYNCYHEEYAVFPDSPPNYTDKQLEEMEAKELEEIEYEGKKYNAYAARQQQRAIERMMRKQKSIIAGYKGAQPEMADELQQAKIKLNQYATQYSNFSKTMGLRTELERVSTGLT